MNWKNELQLPDIDTNYQRIEAVCQKCGHIHYVDIDRLLKKEDMQFKFIFEIERDEVCRARDCDGKCRLALNYRNLSEGFIGGMA